MCKMRLGLGPVAAGDRGGRKGVLIHRPLYPSFVTPWADPSQIQQSRIQEMYAIPPQYAFNPTQMSTKMGQMSEETLMIAFYSSPQDLVQVEAAAELYVYLASCQSDRRGLQ